MDDDKDFQARVQKIGGLVQQLETIVDPASRAAAKELVQLLMDLHGTALERMLEIIFQSGESGAQMINDLGKDPLVSSVLVLYGIHPDDLETRVERKLKQIVSKLHKMGADATLVSAQDGHVRVRASVQAHSCGSTARNARTTIEEAIYEAAPDLASIRVEGLEEPSASSFVGVEKLLGVVPTSKGSVALNSDGMD